MKKILLLGIMVVSVLTSVAQNRLNLDTYAGATLSVRDLNGTARYVGMGGAMEALGADISTMGTNPAGIGLFRKSQVSGSFGVNVQHEGKSFHDGNKTNASFDQIGIILSSRVGATSYLNFGFNFHKNRNFDYVLSAANQAIDGSSLHRQTYVKMLNGDLDFVNPDDMKSGLKYPLRESMIDQLNYRIIDQYDNEGKYLESITPRAIDYMFDRAHTGYIGEYDFNISGNINNHVYLGLTVGVYDVHYHGYSEYVEHFEAPYQSVSGNIYNFPYAKYTDDQRITGTGFDIKLGVIVRPIEESSFRIGASIATPTWYRLTAKNYTTISDQYGVVDDISDNIEFRMDTPWRFGLSAGYTIGTEWAFGLGYEYADYGSIDMRSITDSYYDTWEDTYVTDSESDEVMNQMTDQSLKGVSTVKVGVEYRPDKLLALRLGYNYVSAIFNKSAERNQTKDTPGVYMASTSDYTNWQETHRLTAGVGFTFDKWRFDLAYQFSATSGDFHPYMNISGTGEDITGQVFTMANRANAISVKDSRHQLLCTVNYTF